MLRPPLFVTASLTALLGNTVSGQVALSRSLWRCVIVIIDKQMLPVRESVSGKMRGMEGERRIVGGSGRREEGRRQERAEN